MAYSGHPDSFPADAARALVGDTNPTVPLLDDATWTALLAATSNNVGLTAHRAALALEGKYAQQMDVSIGPERIAYSQLAKAYHDLAINLLASASSDPLAMRFVAPLAGGITNPTTGDDLVPFFSRTTP